MKFPFFRSSLLLAAICGGASLPTHAWAQASSTEELQTRAQRSGLSWEEKTRLKAAHDAAMKDPAVRAIREDKDKDSPAVQQAVRDAMVRIDPTIGPLIDKAQAGRRQSNDSEGDNEDQPQALTASEKEQLRKAHAATRNDPAVITARKQFEAASTTEAKSKASKALREATRAAMLRANPGIKPLLEKTRQQ
jgi:hypothetical protein